MRTMTKIIRKYERIEKRKYDSLVSEYVLTKRNALKGRGWFYRCFVSFFVPVAAHFFATLSMGRERLGKL